MVEHFTCFETSKDASSKDNVYEEQTLFPHFGEKKDRKIESFICLLVTSIDF